MKLPAEFRTTAKELASRVARGDAVWILDVREPREFEICRVPGSTLIPLGELPKRLAELPDPVTGPDIVVHCKAGVRSAKALALLREHGYERIRNLDGGVVDWVKQVDPSQSTY
ncbi:MAG TPA: rhodanese-like domain-containing protein [Vicinamibacterales bacterium]|nr:rhodanese-like domain-containing protein [Vicinamibacterales bacterium]